MFQDFQIKVPNEYFISNLIISETFLFYKLKRKKIVTNTLEQDESKLCKIA